MSEESEQIIIDFQKLLVRLNKLPNDAEKREVGRSMIKSLGIK